MNKVLVIFALLCIGLVKAGGLFAPHMLNIGGANFGTLGKFGYGKIGGLHLGNIGPLRYSNFNTLYGNSFLGAENPNASDDDTPSDQPQEHQFYAQQQMISMAPPASQPPMMIDQGPPIEQPWVGAPYQYSSYRIDEQQPTFDHLHDSYTVGSPFSMDDQFPQNDPMRDQQMIGAPPPPMMSNDQPQQPPMMFDEENMIGAPPPMSMPPQMMTDEQPPMMFDQQQIVGATQMYQHQRMDESPNPEQQLGEEAPHGARHLLKLFDKKKKDDKKNYYNTVNYYYTNGGYGGQAPSYAPSYSAAPAYTPSYGPAPSYGQSYGKGGGYSSGPAYAAAPAYGQQSYGKGGGYGHAPAYGGGGGYGNAPVYGGSHPAYSGYRTNEDDKQSVNKYDYDDDDEDDEYEEKPHEFQFTTVQQDGGLPHTLTNILNPVNNLLTNVIDTVLSPYLGVFGEHGFLHGHNPNENLHYAENNYHNLNY